MTGDEQLQTEYELKVPGNLLSRILLRPHLARTNYQAALYAAALFVIIAFVPILILTLTSGIVRGENVDIPLHRDFITMVRYLVAAPVLIVSDWLTRPYLERTVNRFNELIEDEDTDEFKKMFEGAFLIRSSLLIDFVILVLSIGTSLCGTGIVLTMGESSWQTAGPGGHTLTPPGWWNAFISQPLFRFIVLSWLFDYLVWVYFLWRVTRLRLKLIATHPDKAAGLGFVSAAHSQYSVAAFALSCALCSVVAQAVQHTHAQLTSFSNLGLAFVAIVLIVFIGPLLFFSPMLLRTKIQGIFAYGAICHEQCEDFSGKWVTGKSSEESSLLTSGDPSSLTDMGSNFVTIQSMKPVVFNHQSVMLFLIASAVPALPLVATVMPIQDLIAQIIKALA